MSSLSEGSEHGTRSYFGAAGDNFPTDGEADCLGVSGIQSPESKDEGFNMEHMSEITTSPGIYNCNASLESLPLELLMHICSFLDAKYITDCLSHVSQPFQDILTVDSYWEARITSRWPKIYPAVPVAAGNFDWKKACIEREELYRMWSNPEVHFDQFDYDFGIFAPVDTVHILKDRRVFVSGSRDRNLNIVDIDMLEPGNPASLKAANLYSTTAHKGWIWTLDSLDDMLSTGSWDHCIKLWDLKAGCSEVSEFKCKSAILNIHMEPDLIVAGEYDKRLYLVDPREGIISERRSHRQAVLCLAVDEDFIISGSEDKTLCIFDRRADTVLKTITMESYPMSLSYGEGQLWVGDKQGFIHLYDTSSGAFKHVQRCDVGHKGKVMAIQHTLGAMFTCSTDKDIKVLEPNQNPGVITTLNGGAEVAGIHYRDGILVSAGGGSKVGVWRPKVTKPEESGDQSEDNQDQSHNSAESTQSGTIPQNNT